jgi:hypothetical protein
MRLSLWVVFRRAPGATESHLSAICASLEVAHWHVEHTKEQDREFGQIASIWEIHPWTVTDWTNVRNREDIPRYPDPTADLQPPSGSA